MFTSSHNIVQGARRFAAQNGILRITAASLIVLACAPAPAGATTVTSGVLEVHVNSVADGTFDATTVSPLLSENAGGEWPATSRIIITAPPGFAFNPGQLVTGEVIAGDVDIGGGAGMPFAVAPTATEIIFTVANASTAASTVRFNDIQLRAFFCGAAVAGSTHQVHVCLENPAPPPDCLFEDTAAPFFINVTVVQNATDLHHFRLTADPLAQIAGSNILVTVTAEDACDDPIEDLDIGADLITVTATGGVGVRTYTPGSLSVMAAGANTVTIDNTPTFDGFGQGTFNVTSPTGEDPPITITATLGPVSGSVDVRWITAACTLAPLDALRPVGELHALTATVTQNGATPLPGVDVTFTVQAGGPNAGTTGVVTTNALGQATFFYFSNGMTGVDTVVASVDIGAVNFATCMTTVTWVDPACVITPMTASAVGGMQAVEVTVEQAPGVPAPNGTVVNFEVIAGPNFGALGNAAVAGGAGVATLPAAMYVSNGVAGVDTVRATGVLGGAAFECLTTKEWIDPSCVLDPPLANNLINTPHNLTLTVFRRPGVPAAGIPVTVAIAGENPAAPVLPPAPVTDAAGQVTLTYTGTNPGTDMITVSGNVDGVGFMCTAEKIWIDSGCVIQPLVDTNAAGVGASHTVTITVVRGIPGNNEVANATVNVNVTGRNNVAGAVVTNLAGVATFTYNDVGGPVVPGMDVDTITASTVVDGVPLPACAMPATKTWIDAACTLTHVPAGDSSNPVGTMHTVEVHVTENGLDAAGTLVNFEVLPGGPNAGVFIASALTNGTGRAQASYTSMGATGVDVIRAFGTLGGPPGGADYECTITKTWVVQPSCDIVPMAPSEAGAANMQTVTANIFRAPGVPAVNGTLVDFVIISGPNAGTVGLGIPTAAGVAQFTYADAGGPGQDTIAVIAHVETIDTTCFALKEWIQPSCSLDPVMDINRTGTEHEMLLTVLRRPGVPAVGVMVNVAIAGPNAFATILPSANPTTDANGQVTIRYVGANPGLDTITVSGVIDGVNFMCAATKEWINSGCMLTPMMDTNMVGTQHTVTATVLRTTPPDMPAVGAVVQFEITAGPNVGLVGVGVTNANGITTFTYTSNGVPGTDDIEASTVVDGIPIPDCANIAHKTWISATCMIDPMAETNPVGTNHQVTMTLTTMPDAALANNVPVTMNITAGPNAGLIIPPSATGPGNGNLAGQAVFNYTSNGQFGTDNIRIAGVIPGTTVQFECFATKTWINAQCSLAPATDTNPVGEEHSVTVTVLRDGAAAAGVAVAFNITAGPNNGLVSNKVTNASGKATFTYTGAGGPGTDTIEASGMVDGVPFTCTATKTWQAADGNGIDPNIEDGAPNNGDGNNDGIPDKLQPNVASFLDIFGNYVTLVSPPGTILMKVKSQGTPAEGIVPPGVVFPIGFFSFEVHNVTPGGSIIVDLIMHSNPTVNTYYKYGPTPIIPVDLFYRFLFDGTTGSEVSGNTVRLWLGDGQRGDNDLTANGIIVEPGAPALEAENPAPVSDATCGTCAAGTATMMPLMVLGLMVLKRSRRRIG